MSARAAGGFTLLELLVVLLVIGALMSLAPAAFQRIAPSLETKTAARQLAGLLREARGLAIRDNRETAVVVDTEARAYGLAGRAGAHDLAAATEIALTTATSETLGATAGRIRFFPDGSSTGGRITLSRHEQTLQIDVDWLTGRVRLAE